MQFEVKTHILKYDDGESWFAKRRIIISDFPEGFNFGDRVRVTIEKIEEPLGGRNEEYDAKVKTAKMSTQLDAVRRARREEYPVDRDVYWDVGDFGEYH